MFITHTLHNNIQLSHPNPSTTMADNTLLPTSAHRLADFILPQPTTMADGTPVPTNGQRLADFDFPSPLEHELLERQRHKGANPADDEMIICGTFNFITKKSNQAAVEAFLVNMIGSQVGRFPGTRDLIVECMGLLCERRVELVAPTGDPLAKPTPGGYTEDIGIHEPIDRHGNAIPESCE